MSCGYILLCQEATFRGCINCAMSCWLMQVKSYDANEFQFQNTFLTHFFRIWWVVCPVHVLKAFVVVQWSWNQHDWCGKEVYKGPLTQCAAARLGRRSPNGSHTRISESQSSDRINPPMHNRQSGKVKPSHTTHQEQSESQSSGRLHPNTCNMGVKVSFHPWNTGSLFYGQIRGLCVYSFTILRCLDITLFFHYCSGC